ncbi:heme NO-binding domain-containing protein [Euryhalocaulis caribicus]|uniref:heme NO-binding domain-containing protein n=1 Tax=Euryhalocaulis caribicus TaxID=1161401 RepID=UPI0003A8212C|nr:heme NO-binding domain-containing protein [Euryhalocaulis caribicus]
MIGLIQLVLLDLVEQAGGKDKLAEVRRRGGLPDDFEFRIDTDYPDEEARALIGHACDVLELTPQQAYDAYAVHFLKDVQSRFPVFFAMAPTARDFLKRQPTIHNSMGSGVTGGDSRLGDKFGVTETEDGLITHYQSENRLARLYMSLARALLDHYGETAEVEALDDPDSADCRVAIRWAGAGEAAA